MIVLRGCGGGRRIRCRRKQKKRIFRCVRIGLIVNGKVDRGGRRVHAASRVPIGPARQTIASSPVTASVYRCDVLVLVLVHGVHYRSGRHGVHTPSATVFARLVTARSACAHTKMIIYHEDRDDEAGAELAVQASNAGRFRPSSPASQCGSS